MIWGIFFLINILLDGYISNFFPFYIADLTWYVPFFTFTSLVVFTCLKKKMSLTSWGAIFLCGVLYDSFYTNYFFIHGIIFVICMKLLTYILTRLKLTFLTMSFLFILLLFANQIIFFSFLKLSSHFVLSFSGALLIFLKETVSSLILFHMELWLMKRIFA